jgi:hypothetical protein
MWKFIHEHLVQGIFTKAYWCEICKYPSECFDCNKGNECCKGCPFNK